MTTRVREQPVGDHIGGGKKNKIKNSKAERDQKMQTVLKGQKYDSDSLFTCVRYSPLRQR